MFRPNHNRKVVVVIVAHNHNYHRNHKENTRFLMQGSEPNKQTAV